jgi:hypothetical protein
MVPALPLSFAGFQPGQFREGHALDAKLIKRIPKNMIGKCLSRTQAARLVGSIERGRATERIARTGHSRTPAPYIPGYRTASLTVSQAPGGLA